MRGNKYSIGDIVQLKSGGPKMTIAKFKKFPYSDDNFSGIYKCSWFVENDVKEGDFPEDALIKIE